MRFLQSAFLASLAVIAAAEKPSAVRVPELPLMPRIPSQAKHMEVLRTRAALPAPDTSAVVSTTCVDASPEIDAHDENEAQLSICGGMAGSIDACRGAPATTEGRARTALFSVSAVGADDTIAISKRQWLRCVHAARSACPRGSLSAVCAGGASSGGNVAFTLSKP